MNESVEGGSRTPIVVPELGTRDPIRFVCWLVDEGHPVEIGERIAEIGVPGIVIQISAGMSGILSEQLVHDGETVREGDVIGWIAEEEESL